MASSAASDLGRRQEGEHRAGLGLLLRVDLEAVRPHGLLQSPLLAERVLLLAHGQLQEPQALVDLPQLGGDPVRQLPGSRVPLPGVDRSEKGEPVQPQQQLGGQCPLAVGEQPPHLVRPVGLDLVDPAAFDAGVQRGGDQVAVGDPIALDPGQVAELVGPPTPQLRVQGALRAAELQGRVVVVVGSFAGPQDDPASEQREGGRAAVPAEPLAEPDVAPFRRAGVEAEGGQPGVDLPGPERHLELHPVDAGGSRVGVIDRHVPVVPQPRAAGKPLAQAAGRASIRCSAARACSLVVRSTLTWFGIRPATSSSMAQTRWGRSIRFIVEQKQTVRSRNATVLSGCSVARRWTRFSSVPTAHFEPGGDAWTTLMMRSVEPTSSALATTSWRHSGWTSTRTPGMRWRTRSTCSGRKRWWTEQWPRHSSTLAALTRSGSRPPSSRWGSQTTQSAGSRPIAMAVLRPRCWSGRNSTRSARWNAQLMARAALEEVQTAPPSRPVNPLIAAEEFM